LILIFCLFVCLFVCCYRADAIVRSRRANTFTHRSTSRTSCWSTGAITLPSRTRWCFKWAWRRLASPSYQDRYPLS
jgi:hypothetical protein